MSINSETRLAYTEVYELFEFLGKEYKVKIPKKLYEFLKENRLKEYNKAEYKNRIINNELSNNAINIYASLKIKYLCEDEFEKKMLNEIFKNNIKQEYFEYRNIDDVFNSKKNYKKTDITNLPQTKSKSIFYRLFSYIKSKIFNK